MFVKKNCFSTTLCRKLVSALLGFSVLAVSLSLDWKTEASDKKSAADVKTKSKPASGIELSDFRAERVSDTVRLSWKTSFEAGNLGFRIWRDEAGERSPVNGELVAGSVFKVGNGVLPAGDEYAFRDEKGSEQYFYWLEAVALDGESRWFGPVEVQFGAKESIEEDSRTLAALFDGSVKRPNQIEKVEFSAGEKTTELAAASSSTQLMLSRDPNALKFEVREDGWYRVGYDILAMNGFNVQGSSNWKLFADGVEQPIVVNGDGSIEFYGQGIETVQTNARVYWFTTNSGPGKRFGSVKQKNTQAAAEGWSRRTAERRDKVIHVSSVLNGDRENWFGPVVNSSEVTQPLYLSEIATESGETATLGIDIQGIGYNMPHRVSVSLNGSVVGQINFTDWQRMEWSVSVPLSLLRTGLNEVKLRSVSTTTDVSLLEAVRINYPYRSNAENNRLVFSLRAKKAVKLKGFSGQGIKVFDISNPDSATQLQPTIRQESDGSFSAHISSASTSRLLMAHDDAASFLNISSWTRNIPSDLSNTGNQAAFVVIAPRQFHGELSTFKNMRDAQGLSTVVVDPVDIYDEFGFGIRSAQAIRSFLQYARQNWSLKPNYVMIVGDASNDPKNYSGFGGEGTNLVPTMFCDTWNMEATSDAMMADFNGDSIEDMAIGRLPVRSSTELAAVLNKILIHDSFSDFDISQRGVLMVSDVFNGYDFATGSRNAAGTIPAGVNLSYFDAGMYDPATDRQNLINSINMGPAVVNYFGHGLVGAWSGRGLLRSQDTPGLTNYSLPSLFVMLACLNGYYAETRNESIAETALRVPTGGAYAVWAATGWNGAVDQELMAREYYRRAFGGMRLGDAARESKSLFSATDLRRTFVFFGDPTQRLVANQK